ncbi:MAG: methyltransferase domain-containing protein [Rhodospirillales bacterium]|jgi:sarcosine/dimethylglycine N-methyltransferase|nr:methyltransferase domain-containing protein [Rhodospirillales bacterium]MBT4040135.1 methyltransferase domain-containing protein [Rhodospirillales bacterium]MBT4625466.1 methyltransferase domain-containing protein [Rhodospirillales bacterium]MBT5352104.1 methyltransferase domain-containing protein [Rhodospirillales bacterium]MBT5521873.1 methyltransferase domain-containing protein [Rhodospirillales bacterium]
MNDLPTQHHKNNSETQSSWGKGLERYDTEETNRLYYTVWGESIHFGIRLTDDCTFDQAIVHTKRHIAEALGITANHHVLEVASGVGETARFFAKEYGCTVTATNISNQHLATSSEKASHQDLSRRVDNVWADFHDLPFEDKTFDGYWVQEGIVHAKDKATVISEAFRVLKPGGRIVISEQTTETSLMSKDEQARLAARHGSPDLLNADGFIRLMIDQSFRMIRDDDMSTHLAPLFDAIVGRIEDDYATLTQDISKHIVDWNLDNWRFGAAKARDGALGWHILVAERPSVCG